MICVLISNWIWGVHVPVWLCNCLENDQSKYQRSAVNTRRSQRAWTRWTWSEVGRAYNSQLHGSPVFLQFAIGRGEFTRERSFAWHTERQTPNDLPDVSHACRPRLFEAASMSFPVFAGNFRFTWCNTVISAFGLFSQHILDSEGPF